MDEGGFILDYIMPAGSSLEETNRVITHVEEILRSHARSREHLAPHRPATRSRPGHRSQYRRYLRQTEARPQTQRRRSHRRRPRQNQKGGAGARRRIPAAPAGHDRRSHQRARTRRHQAVRPGSGTAARLGPASRRRHQENPRRGGRARRHRKHHQRARHGLQCRSRRRRARRLHPAGSGTRCQRHPARRTRPAPVVVNDRSYTIRVRFPRTHPRVTSNPSATPC